MVTCSYLRSSPQYMVKLERNDVRAQNAAGGLKRMIGLSKHELSVDGSGSQRQSYHRLVNDADAGSLACCETQGRFFCSMASFFRAPG